MSTATKQHLGSNFPSPPNAHRDDKQVRRDRWTAFVVFALLAALIGLIIWLASLGGGVEYEGIDYWHMMP